MVAICGGLAVASVAGGYIYGEFSSRFPNPLSLIVGIFLAVIFVVTGVYALVKQRLSTDWEGVVIGKEVKNVTRSYGAGDYTQVDRYVVTAKDTNGAIHKLAVDNLGDMYRYYQIGEKVRAYSGLLAWEKYDKTKDSQLICVACQRVNNLGSDHCSYCHCPLLK